jgi:hypothetical protein
MKQKWGSENRCHRRIPQQDLPVPAVLLSLSGCSPAQDEGNGQRLCTGVMSVNITSSGFHCGELKSNTRKPTLLLRLSGFILLRMADRQLRALLFQLPPRITRFEPLSAFTPIKKLLPQPVCVAMLYVANQTRSRADEILFLYFTSHILTLFLPVFSAKTH